MSKIKIYAVLTAFVLTVAAVAVFAVNQFSHKATAHNHADKTACCGDASCCSGGTCKMGGACCGNHKAAAKTGQTVTAQPVNFENTGVAIEDAGKDCHQDKTTAATTAVAAEKGESCCGSGAACCPNGACCDKNKAKTVAKL